MANLDRNKTLLDSVKEEDDSMINTKEQKDDFSTNFKEEDDNFPAKPSSSITDENEFDLGVVPRVQDMLENGYRAPDSEKRIKPMDNCISTFLKLRAFFEVVEKQHPESRLELQQVNGTWRVWCGVCKKLLRPDKSGKAIHNIQRQHFTSARHKKKLHLMLQAEEEEADSQRKNAGAKSSATRVNEHGNVKD